MEMNLRFEKMEKKDVPALTEIMKEAFNADSELHLGEGVKMGPPGYDNGEFLMKWGINAESQSFVIYQNDEMIGAVILWINEDHVNYLGNLFITPKYQAKGVGTKVWQLIEEKYPDTVQWRTDTIAYSRKNHSFYVNKCGFKIVRIEDSHNGIEASYLMEKDMK